MIDEGSFVREVIARQDMLYRLAVSYLRHDADAQDAVQQAVEKAWKHRTRVDQDGFAPWLTRIVINECKSVLRRRKRAIPSERMELYEGETPPPDLSMADALSRLPEKLRTPLLLHYIEQFSVDETARALGLPATTVRSRLHRARIALRKELDGKEGERA